MRRSVGPDGTLVDSAEYHWLSWCEALTAAGHRFDRDYLVATFGQRNDRICRIVRPGRAGRGDRAHQRCEGGLLSRPGAERGLDLRPGAELWLKRLRASGWRQALATSAPAPMWRRCLRCSTWRSTSAPLSSRRTCSAASPTRRFSSWPRSGSALRPIAALSSRMRRPAWKDARHGDALGRRRRPARCAGRQPGQPIARAASRGHVRPIAGSGWTSNRYRTARASAAIPRRVGQGQRYSGGRSSPPMKTPQVSMDHPSFDRDRQVAVDFPRATAGHDPATVRSETPPGMMMIRSPARLTSSAISSSPSSGEGFCPVVRIRLSPARSASPTPRRDHATHQTRNGTSRSTAAQARLAQVRSTSTVPSGLSDQSRRHPRRCACTARYPASSPRTRRPSSGSPPRGRDDDVHADVQQPAGELNRACAGGAATLQQVGAQLDAVGPAGLCGKRCFDRIRTSFDEDVGKS